MQLTLRLRLDTTSDLLRKVEIRLHLEITQILFGYLLDLH